LTLIGYPRGKVLAVFDTLEAATAAAAAVAALGTPGRAIERFAGPAHADRFDATGQRHGPIARALRAMQFSLMDQLPAMAWYEAALRAGHTVLAVPSGDRATTLRVVEALRRAGGHFINRFGRLSTEEFARWRGPEPPVSSLMKH
jgi:hypothetical protein